MASPPLLGDFSERGDREAIRFGDASSAIASCAPWAQTWLGAFTVRAG